MMMYSYGQDGHSVPFSIRKHMVFGSGDLNILSLIFSSQLSF